MSFDTRFFQLKIKSCRDTPPGVSASALKFCAPHWVSIEYVGAAIGRPQNRAAQMRLPDLIIGLCRVCLCGGEYSQCSRCKSLQALEGFP